MRVAYLTHYAELYGANLSLLDLLEELRAQGVRPLVILPAPGPFEARLRALNIAVEIVPFEPWMSVPHASGRWYHRWVQRWQQWRAARFRAARNAKAAGTIGALLKARGIDLLHANSVVVGVVPALLRSISVPVVWHVRELPGAHYGLVPDVGRTGYQRALNGPLRSSPFHLPWSVILSLPVSGLLGSIPLRTLFFLPSGLCSSERRGQRRLTEACSPSRRSAWYIRERASGRHWTL